mmetsp:Transcript_20396/g.34791  ORF Transcript_20396/g.34791 Transcript_20396/m.34791 type:complete len:433 (+) Transcript_20396:94-1392(+)
MSPRYSKSRKIQNFQGFFLLSSLLKTLLSQRHSSPFILHIVNVMKILIGTLALLIGSSHAACPNQCSGHGTCGVDEVCTCFPGWGTGGDAGGDCSDRFCPHELAWADFPSRGGNRHKYAECANMGECDRKLGQCECFDGYEGKACARQSCPNHCSGHGTCEYMKDLQFGIVYNEYYDGSSPALSGLGAGGMKFAQDYVWDSDRARLCVCDAGWTGLSCEERMCPYGNDVMDVIPGFDEYATTDSNGIPGLAGYGNEVGQIQTVTLYDAEDDISNFVGQTFALKFTSKLNETFVTQPIMWDSDLDVVAEYIEAALEKLPNRVVDDVVVSAESSSGATGVVINVSFIGRFVQGRQHKLEVVTDRCEVGCTPRITGLANLRSFSDTTLSTVEITTVGSHQSHECGRRGKCDRKKGVCECFTGFIGAACGTITALA